MNEIKVNVNGYSAHFANARDLHVARRARPELFRYTYGVLRFLNEQTGEWCRVILPITSGDLNGQKER